jgi:hypothetical protein
MNENTNTPIISSAENVARLVSSEWMKQGVLQPVAFTLDLNESYLSVNRPAIDSYDADVLAFVNSHPLYGVNGVTYFRAMLNVGEIRKIKAQTGETMLMAEVDVEPRDSHTKSHAGIFVRYQNENIKRGTMLKMPHASEEVSTDSILLDVRTQLYDIALLEECKLNKEETI